MLARNRRKGHGEEEAQEVTGGKKVVEIEDPLFLSKFLTFYVLCFVNFCRQRDVPGWTSGKMENRWVAVGQTAVTVEQEMLEEGVEKVQRSRRMCANRRKSIAVGEASKNANRTECRLGSRCRRWEEDNQDGGFFIFEQVYSQFALCFVVFFRQSIVP
ncbi:hypothetical protein B9Z55_004095 [Caenorhabditis nigoni]|uniref:Uncharacterized protein n=1 Tax=Caenorhabditis nigoni TaxID=1611254 RepID=A0A2G5UUV5_9PELO|nr:hypothetical protein B9Z55_004095 [Caenorhabditis nigoni]